LEGTGISENVPVGGGGDMGHGHDAIRGIPGISPPKLEKEHGRNISLCLFRLIKIVIELEVVISIPHSTGRSDFPPYIIDQNYYLIRR
jgi:hypothetical protein